MSSIRTLSLVFCAFLFSSAVFASEELPAGDQSSDTEEPAPWYKNVVPVPFIITEPAIGQGLGVGVGYFHPVESADSSGFAPIENPEGVMDATRESKPPPVVTGIFGGGTNNGSWAVGAGHVNTFRDDTIRYLGAVAYASVIADFYVLDRPFEFNLEGYMVYQDVKFRIAGSNWFLGVALSYLDASNEFSVKPPDPQDVEQTGFFASSFQDVGIKGRVMYETRDDTMMPGRGRLFDLSVVRNGEFLGGDYDYTTAKAKFLSFHPLGSRFVLGLRGEYATVSGDPPFYAIPWVSLRGIPAMRFQGRDVAVAEVEGRYSLNENWAMVAFYGRGWTDIYQPELETGERIRAFGLGGRWRALKSQGVWVGLDLARGPEDTVLYVQVGHPW